MPLTEYDYKYCLFCAGRLTQKGKSILVCGECGYQHFLNARPAAGVILRYEDKYGLCKRAIEPQKGKWDTIGGFVDYTENFEQALRREVKEEAGIELDNFTYIGSVNHEYEYKKLIVRPLAILFESKIGILPNFKPADDISEVRFFTKDEFPLDDLAFPEYREMFVAMLNVNK